MRQPSDGTQSTHQPGNKQPPVLHWLLRSVMYFPVLHLGVDSERIPYSLAGAGDTHIVYDIVTDLILRRYG